MWCVCACGVCGVCVCGVCDMHMYVWFVFAICVCVYVRGHVCIRVCACRAYERVSVCVYTYVAIMICQ